MACCTAHQEETLNACRSLRTHWHEPCVKLNGHRAPRTFASLFIGSLCSSVLTVSCMAVVANKAQSIGVPSYLASLVNNYVPTRALRSADQFLLCSPIVKLVCSRKTFSVNAPLVFNALPYNCRSARTLSSFKKLIKTHLFSGAYGLF